MKMFWIVEKSSARRRFHPLESRENTGSRSSLKMEFFMLKRMIVAMAVLIFAMDQISARPAQNLRKSLIPDSSESSETTSTTTSTNTSLSESLKYAKLAVEDTGSLVALGVAKAVTITLSSLR